MTTLPHLNVISGDAIRTAISLKSHTYTVQSIKVSTLDSVEEFIESLPDGWEVEKQYKTSIKIKKRKPAFEKFTDKVWLTLAKMGFDEITEDENFGLPFLNDNRSQLFNIFAKDDETALFISCIDTSTLSEYELESELQNYKNTLLSRLYSVTKKMYGTNSDIKVKMIVFLHDLSSNISISELNDKTDAVVYDEKHLEYFNALVVQLKRAARYQFLAYLFPNQKIKNLAKKVFATRGKMGNHTFYTFLMHPNDLLKISFFAHKANEMSNDVRAY